MGMSECYSVFSREEMIARIVSDRDEVFSQLEARRPELRGAYPYELLRAAIRTVCGFRVAPRVLVPGQMALCDFQQKIVYYNSELRSFVSDKASLKGLVNSTLAHELGHIRLHYGEMSSRKTRTFDMGNGMHYHVGNRDFQREMEADLYAAVFLVPGKLLIEEAAAKKLHRWHTSHRQVKSSTIWRQIFILAKRFQVSPTLMKRCLEECGWIVTKEVRMDRASELEIRFKD